MKKEPLRRRGRPKLGDVALVKREFSLQPDQMREIERMAEETGKSLSQVGRELIAAGLEARLTRAA